MAIIIPSKNIFEKTNSKIIDNQIEGVIIEQTSPQILVQYDENVYRTKLDLSSGSVDLDESPKSSGMGGSYYNLTQPKPAIVDTRVLLQKYYIDVGNIAVPKHQKMSNIKNLSSNPIELYKNIQIRRASEFANYQFTIDAATGAIVAGNFYHDLKFPQQADSSATNFENLNFEHRNVGGFLANMLVPNAGQDYKDNYSTLQSIKSDQEKLTFYVDCMFLDQPSEVGAMTVSKIEFPIPKESFTTTETNENYIISSNKVFVGFRAFLYFTGAILGENINEQGFYNARVFAVEAMAKEISLGLKGDLVKLDIDTEKVSYGRVDETRNIFNLGTNNELFQTSSIFLKSDSESIAWSDANTDRANKILLNYQNGKETAEIRCSVSDYYDESDKYTPVISKSGKKKIFAVGDEVIPMVFGRDGKDYPLSIDEEGNPKIFRVVRNKRKYQGVFWQLLTLQEKGL